MLFGRRDYELAQKQLPSRITRRIDEQMRRNLGMTEAEATRKNKADMRNHLRSYIKYHRIPAACALLMFSMLLGGCQWRHWPQGKVMEGWPVGFGQWRLCLREVGWTLY